MLPEDKMPEAEVSLRLGFFLIKKGITASDVKVAIDGAQVRTGDQIRFDVNGFLASQGWRKCSTNDRWQGTYKNDKWDFRIEVHSVPGLGDVVAQLKSGEILRVECKKGPLGRSKSSQEYPLIREALGQKETGVGPRQLSDTAKETVIICANHALKTAFLGLKMPF